jgi:hypothetical protein
MENLLHEDFRGVKSKNSSDEALRRWRDVCGFVKNPKRRFRFTANLHKRGEAAAMRRTNQVSFFIHFLLLFINDMLLDLDSSNDILGELLISYIIIFQTYFLIGCSLPNLHCLHN